MITVAQPGATTGATTTGTPTTSTTPEASAKGGSASSKNGAKNGASKGSSCRAGAQQREKRSAGDSQIRLLRRGGNSGKSYEEKSKNLPNVVETK